MIVVVVVFFIGNIVKVCGQYINYSYEGRKEGGRERRALDASSGTRDEDARR